MTVKRGYQLHFSRGDTVLGDVLGRGQKFKKILSVLTDHCGATEPYVCLDIGCSRGVMTSLLGDHFSMVFGVDIDREAVRDAHAHFASSRVQFLAGDSMAIPFGDKTIDVIVCNHVYEHVPEAKQMMEEIYRVLKTKGVCYFAAGNRYAVMEGHYHLPFLSWLPKPLSHLYLRLTGKGSFYYEEHLSCRGLRRLTQAFHIHDYTLPIIRTPEKFFATDLLHAGTFMHRLTRKVAPYLYPLVPTYIWILTKK